MTREQFLALLQNNPETPKFLIHGRDEYEPAVFFDERDLVRFCLATLALVSIRDDDKLRDQVAQILKALVHP